MNRRQIQTFRLRHEGAFDLDNLSISNEFCSSAYGLKEIIRIKNIESHDVLYSH